MLLTDIALARGFSVPFEPGSDLQWQPYAVIIFILTTATIPASLASYIDDNHPELMRLASQNLHRLHRSLKTEYVDWSRGNRNSDVESGIRRVCAGDSLRCTDGQIGPLPKVLNSCNRRNKVEDLATFLIEKDIKNVALTGTAELRKRRSNHHLDGLLRVRNRAVTVCPDGSSSAPPALPNLLPPTQRIRRRRLM